MATDGKVVKCIAKLRVSVFLKILYFSMKSLCALETIEHIRQGCSPWAT